MRRFFLHLTKSFFTPFDLFSFQVKGSDFFYYLFFLFSRFVLSLSLSLSLQLLQLSSMVNTIHYRCQHLPFFNSVHRGASMIREGIISHVGTIILKHMPPRINQALCFMLKGHTLFNGVPQDTTMIGACNIGIIPSGKERLVDLPWAYYCHLVIEQVW